MFKIPCYTLFILLVISNSAWAKEYKAATIKEVIQAESKLQPGDVLILLNGNWKDAELSFTISGTSDKHIIIRAEEAGKVILSGNSSLRLGGNYLDVFGLYFTNGYADDDVISFRNASHIANNCRVSNCAIFNYNPPNRMKENSWIAFYGKNNRFDHNYISDKKNLGTTLVVELNDEKNQQNFHRSGTRERFGDSFLHGSAFALTWGRAVPAPILAGPLLVGGVASPAWRQSPAQSRNDERRGADVLSRRPRGARGAV